MKKRIIAMLLVLSSITFNAYAGELKNESNLVNKIDYSTIEKIILEKNTAVRINKNTLDSFQINYENLSEAEEDMKDGIKGLESALRMYIQQKELIAFDGISEDEGVDIALKNIEQLLKGIFSANISTLIGNISSMETQLENLQEQKEDMVTTIDKMTLNGQMVNNQMVWAGENLIFAYDAINELIKSTNKNIDMLQDQLRILKIQEDLGNISNIDTESIELKIEELNSTKETLDNQKLNIKRQLNLLLGQSYATELEVLFTPELNDYRINSIDNKKDLTTAIKNSYELKLMEYDVEAKERALSRIMNDDDDDDLNEYKLAKIDYENINLQLEDAKRNYELKFQQTYEAVKDKQKVMALEEKKLAQEKTKLEVAKKKYDLGMISKVEYDNTKSAYDLQEIKVETIKGDLFTAYRKYEWMLKGLCV